MVALFLSARRLRDVKPEVHDRAIRASLAGKHPGEFDMIALHEEYGVWKQRIDQGRVPHQIPLVLGLGLDPLEFPAWKRQAVVEAERFEIGHVAMQDIAQGITMQEA